MPFAIRYRGTSDPNEWLSLADIREALPGGKWMNSPFYEQVGAAVRSHLAPSAFWQMSEQDRAFIIAYYRVEGTIRAYEDHLFEKDMERRKRSQTRK